MANVLPDSPTVLQNGTGTPYLAIFNGSQQPIMDSKNNLPIGVFVTSFEYSYIEEDCDEGKIFIETDNPDLVALDELDYYRPLQLQWGYIFPSKLTYVGPIRKVMITGREVTFDESGTHITLTVSDASVILKNISAKYFNTGGFVEYLTDILNGNGIGIIMRDYREVPMTQQVVLQQTISNQEVQDSLTQYQEEYGVNENNNNTVYSPDVMPQANTNKVYYEPGVPTRVYPNLVGVKILEADSTHLELAENYPEYFRVSEIQVGGAHSLLIKGINPNKYGQAKEIFSWAKNGPYFLDGRDNMLQVHNQLVNRPISKIYTHAGGNGELLEFRVSSEFTTTVVGVTRTMELTEDKQIKGTNTQVVNQDDSPSKADLFIYWPEGMKHNPPQDYNIGQASWDIDANTWVDPGRFTQPGWSVKVPENFYKEPTREIKKVSSSSPEMVYSSLQAAKDDITSTLKLTQEEVGRFWSERKEAFNQCLQRANISNGGPNNQDELGRFIHEFENLGDLVIKRKAKIRAIVDLRAYADPENQAAIGAVLNGEKDFMDVPDRLMYSRGVPFTGDRKAYKAGYSFLNSIEGIKIITDTSEIRKQYQSRGSDNGYPSELDLISDSIAMASKAIIEYEATFEIPVDGTRIIANYPFEWASSVMPTQMEEHTQDQIEATAVVIGDPCLESSMNILIRNVSSKYSGVWYTKKVTHRFSVGLGYKCDIEFRQRTTDVITNIATCNIDLKKVYTNLQKLAQEALKEGKSFGATNNTTNEWVNKQQEAYRKGEKETTLINLPEGRLDTVETYSSSSPVPYSNPLDNQGKVMLVQPTPGSVASDDPYFNYNSEGAKNTQNS